MKKLVVCLGAMVVATMAWAANANCVFTIASSDEMRTGSKSERLGASRASDAGGIPDGGALGAAATFSATEGGTIDIANPSDGEGWTVSGGVVTIGENGSYTITGTSTSNRVVVGAGVTATVTLSNASITSAVASPLELSSVDCRVTLRLVGSNRLVATTWQTNPFSAGLQVPRGASVVIEGTGALYAKGCGQEDVNGNDGGAGIGSAGIDSEPGKSGNMTGTITINSGVITAEGGDGGTGIGGGSCGGAGAIIINGGVVTATGGYTAAGIGSGLYSVSVNNITINGGTVAATGGMYAAAIGGGADSRIGNIRITGGTITTNGGRGGSGIGGGARSSAGVITITGGAITATGGVNASGIGGGTYAGQERTITITGGGITATGGDGGAGIGGGTWAIGGAINISGGNVSAISISGGASIGGGAYANGGDITITGGKVVALSEGSTATTTWGNPAAIGGGGRGSTGSGGQAGNIRITGGGIYAYSRTSAGIGGGNGGSGGSITVSGGSITANSIGIGAAGSITPTTVSAGAIIAGSINATSFGQAAVLTEKNLSEAFIRTAAENAWHDTVKIRNTIEILVPVRVPETVIHITDTIRDTLPFIRHDTIEEHRYYLDTLWDITWDTLYVYDTISVLVPAYDTLYATDTLYIDTAYTLYGERRVIIATPDGSTGITAPSTAIAVRALALADGSILLEGLTAGKPFAIYTLTGTLVLRAPAPAGSTSGGTTCLLRHLPSGTYLLQHEGHYFKFGHK